MANYIWRAFDEIWDGVCGLAWIATAIVAGAFLCVGYLLVWAFQRIYEYAIDQVIDSKYKEVDT